VSGGESENVSEKPTSKRGRPRSRIRASAENLERAGLQAEGCLRTKINHAYLVAFLRVLRANPEAFRAFVGHTEEEIASGAARLPKGHLAAAIEIARYIEQNEGSAEEAVRIAADARGRGISFGDIAAHFRRLRLGEKEGSAGALTTALVRTVDAYRRQFPKTTDQQVLAALENVAGLVADPEP